MSETPLKIAWATPWNGNSAIAVFSRTVVGELLARGHSVDILRTEVGDVSRWPPADPIEGVDSSRYAKESNPYELSNKYDVVVANFGDYVDFHAGALVIVGRVPLVVVMHDANYDNFVRGLNGYPDLLTLIRSIGYPDAGSDAMVDWLAANAIAAVAHGSHYVGLFSQCGGPVAVLPLVYPDLNVPPREAQGSSFIVATIGHINPNKRADAVIEAIGVSPKLRQRCEYRLIGHVPALEERRLKTVAEEAGLAIAPRFTGWVADEELRQHLAEVDAICALRHPVLEGGSASLITALLSARPTLVSDQEHYTVPEGLVLKCAPGDEALDVARHLEWLCDNPAQGLAIGRHAREHALRHHRPAHYVDQLLDLIIAGSPRAAVIATQNALKQILVSLQAPAGDPAEARLQQALAEMVGGRS